MSSDHSANLDRFAPFYDLEYGTYDEDLDFYTLLAARLAGRARGATVLDLACGTGRVARALAAAGHQVTGVDAAPALLAHAAQQAKAAGQTIRLVEADLRALPAPATLGHFHLVLCALNSFAYLLTVDEQLACLQGVRALLRPTGRLVLDLTPVPPDGPAPDGGEVILQGTWPHPDGGVVSKYVTGHWDHAAQLHDVTWIYDVTAPDGLLRRTLIPQQFRATHRYEAEHLLARAGVPLLEVYGDYDLAPYGADSPRLLLVAAPA